MSALRHHWKKMLVATNKYCGERRMRRRKGEEVTQGEAILMD
jgi:hypothetical protein